VPHTTLPLQDYIIEAKSWPWVEATVIKSTGGGFFGSDMYLDLEFIDGTVEEGVHGSEVRLQEANLDEDSGEMMRIHGIFVDCTHCTQYSYTVLTHRTL
jgi:hypothetical protein